MGLLTQYRNISALTAVIVVQLVMLAHQVRSVDGGTLLRAWALGALAPVANLMHQTMGVGSSAWEGYFWLVDVREENETIQRELDRLRLENQYLRRDLSKFERQEELVAYQQDSPSETVLAEVIGGGADPSSKELLINRGRKHGLLPDNAVITAEGIVGKIQASYSSAALVLLINDSDAGVGVVLSGSRVRGVLKGRGERDCFVEYVGQDVEVRQGEAVYTSGEDRVFPKGLPVGEVVSATAGPVFQRIVVRPYVELDRLDEVLAIVTGVHQDLPDRTAPQMPKKLLSAPPVESQKTARGRDSDEVRQPSFHVEETDADRVKERYRDVAARQGYRFSRGESWEPAPDFNLGHPSSPSYWASVESDESSAPGSAQEPEPESGDPAP